MEDLTVDFGGGPAKVVENTGYLDLWKKVYGSSRFSVIEIAGDKSNFGLFRNFFRDQFSCRDRFGFRINGDVVPAKCWRS